MTKLKILFLFLIASFLVKAQTLQVALPDTSADPGASLQIPIYVDDLTGLNVISYQMTVQYDNQVVEATGITTDGTISDEGGWTVLPNTNFDAQIKVGGFGISGLSGGGILLYLNFDVVGEVGTSDLTFTEMVFNSGDPASEPVNGSISINVDTVAVMIADQTEFTGNNVNFPINVEDLTGYSVNTIYFQINYDSSILEFVEYNNSDLTTGWDATAEENLPGTVVVTMFGDDLSGAGSLGDIVFNVTGAEGSSNIELDEFLFNTGNPAASVTNATFTVEVRSVDVSLPDLTSRSGTTVDVTVTVSDLTDMNIMDYFLTVNYDPELISFTEVIKEGGISESFTVDPLDDPTTGTLDIIAFGDVNLQGEGELLNLRFSIDAEDGTSPLVFSNVQFSNGNPVANTTDGSITIFVDTVFVDIPDTAIAQNGNHISLPVIISDLTDMGVISYQFKILYDETLLSATGINVDGTVSDVSGWTALPNVNVPGVLQVGAFGASPIAGDGNLINLEFDVIGEIGTAQLDFENFTFNSGLPRAELLPGVVTVIAPPVISSQIQDIEINEDSEYSIFDLNSNFSDPNETQLTFEAASDNEEIVVDINGNSLNIVPNENYFGTGHVIVTATNEYELSISDTFQVTILSVNDTPILTGIPDVSFDEDSSTILSLNQYVYDVEDDTTEINFTAEVLNSGLAFNKVLKQNINKNGNFVLTVGLDDLVIEIDDITHIATISATADSSGTFDVVFTATDSDDASDSDTIQVVVSGINDIPTIINPIEDLVLIEDGADTLVAVLSNVFADADPGDELNYDWMLSEDGINPYLLGDTLWINLSADFNGIVEVYLSATDLFDGVVTDTFSITVQGINDPPILTGIPDVNFAEDDSTYIYLNDYLSDVDNDTTEITFDAQVVNSGLAFNISQTKSVLENGNVVLTVGPDDLIITIDNELNIATIKASADSSGSFEVIFTATDTGDLFDTDTINVTVDPVDDPPTISPIPDIVIQEDDSIYVNYSEWLSYIEDIDSEVFNFEFNYTGENFTYEMVGTDSIKIKPTLNWFGSDSLEITISDLTNSVSAWVNVIVESVNDVPIFIDLPETITFENDSIVVLGLWSYTEDVETPDSLLSFDFETTTDSLTLSFNDSNGELSISASNGFIGNAELNISVTDENEGMAEATIQIDVLVGLKSDDNEIPTAFKLFNNYPNPFNPSTIIRYALPVESKVRLSIYNVLGERITELLNGSLNAGYHEITWNASNIPSGMYLLVINAESINSGETYYEIKKMLLIK